jgi:iron complex transport system ATP-binding protein
MANENKRYKGVVQLNGKEINSYSVRALSKQRAVLSQNNSIQFGFTVEQVVSLGRYASTLTKSEDQSLIEEVVSLTGVASLWTRQYATLSGGEQQRVQLTRVLVQVWEESLTPRYILLDEPTSSLDISQQQQIFGLAKKACTRNIGVMAIVHDLNQAVQFSDTLYFLKNGSIVSYGETKSVFNKINIEETFGCRVNFYHDPCTDCPFIIPQGMDDSFERNQRNKLVIN